MKYVARAIIGFLLLGIFVVPIFSTTAPQGLPWEGPLESIKNSLTGPVALVIAIVAIVSAGFMLIFGGSDFSGFTKTILYIVLVVGIIMGSGNIISTLFGGGATINTEKQVSHMEYHER